MFLSLVSAILCEKCKPLTLAALLEAGMTDSTKDVRKRRKENMEAGNNGDGDDSLFGIWGDNPAVEDVGKFIDEIRGRRSEWQER
jgi:hypothetical protein